MIVKENLKVNEFGELISAEQTIIKKVNVEEFCQVYLQDSEDFSNLSGSEYKILIQCWLHSVYYKESNLDIPGNVVTFNSLLKESIQKVTGLKDGTIRNTFSSLVKKGMLLKPEGIKGIYYLNPKYFFKGKLTERTKLIKKSIEYQLEEQHQKI